MARWGPTVSPDYGPGIGAAVGDALGTLGTALVERRRRKQAEQAYRLYSEGSRPTAPRLAPGTPTAPSRGGYRTIPRPGQQFDRNRQVVDRIAGSTPTSDPFGRDLPQNLRANRVAYSGLYAGMDPLEATMTGDLGRAGETRVLAAVTARRKAAEKAAAKAASGGMGTGLKGPTTLAQQLNYDQDLAANYVGAATGDDPQVRASRAYGMYLNTLSPAERRRGQAKQVFTSFLGAARKATAPKRGDDLTFGGGPVAPRPAAAAVAPAPPPVPHAEPDDEPDEDLDDLDEDEAFEQARRDYEARRRP